MHVLLEAREISVDFGHISALRQANLKIRTGETLALVGDNGAGKTTLVRVLGGELAPTGGQIFHEGQPIRSQGVRDAQNLGIHIVYQDLALCPDLTAAENLSLGHEPVRGGLAGRMGFLDRRAATVETERRLGLLQIRLPDIESPIRSLSGGQRQSLAVARGLTYGNACILMDEPTASLGTEQTSMVYKAIRQAALSGVAVVVVSHDLTQVLEFADRVAIMRHGRVVAVRVASGLTVRSMIDIMMGAVDPQAENEFDEGIGTGDTNQEQR